MLGYSSFQRFTELYIREEQHREPYYDSGTRRCFRAVHVFGPHPVRNHSHLDVYDLYRPPSVTPPTVSHPMVPATLRHVSWSQLASSTSRHGHLPRVLQKWHGRDQWLSVLCGLPFFVPYSYSVSYRQPHLLCHEVGSGSCVVWISHALFRPYRNNAYNIWDTFCFCMYFADQLLLLCATYDSHLSLDFLYFSHIILLVYFFLLVIAKVMKVVAPRLYHAIKDVFRGSVSLKGIFCWDGAVEKVVVVLQGGRLWMWKTRLGGSVWPSRDNRWFAWQTK